MTISSSLGDKKLEVYWDEKVSSFRCWRDLYNCPIPESKNIEIIGNMNEYPEHLTNE